MLPLIIMFTLAILVGVKLGRRAKRTPANYLPRLREIFYV